MESSPEAEYEMVTGLEDQILDCSTGDDVCRICATTNEYLITIFEGEGLENDLCGKINSLLPITVSREDELTHLICYQCASHILAWNDLRQCAAHADKHLRDILKRRSQIDDEAAEIEKQINVEEVPVVETEIETVQEENKAIPNPATRSRILQHRKTSEIIIIRVESKNTKSKYLRKNNRAHIQHINSDVERTPAADAVKSVNEEILAKDTKYPCPKCCDAYAKKSELMHHLFIEHVEGDGAPGRARNKIDHKAVEKAKMCVDGRVYYHCEECGKNLHSPYTFSWHARIHTGERPFVCDLCGKQFRVSQGLARHLRETHAGIKKFPCDICHRHFATKRNVAEHRRIHTGERPYVCALCGKAFKQKASLFVHNRSHTDVYPFSCAFCSQRFRTKPTLRLHVMKHTGVKPFECSICGRCFRIKYELKRHMLIHSSEKPFACQICNVSFRQKRYLTNHNKNNHRHKAADEEELAVAT